LVLYIVLAFTRTATARYGAALTALILLALSPPLTFFVLRSASPVPRDFVGFSNNALQALGNTASKLLASEPAPQSVDWLSWFVLAWFTGVLVFAVRALGGWVVIERLRREKTQPIAQALHHRCLMLQRRLNLSTKIRYLASQLMDSPAVIGWFRPVVLLPVTALTGLAPEQLEAVIAHELAHIKRLDCFVNLLQIVVETVLFYHPAVWWVNRCIRSERENCCDDIAVHVCGNAGSYARALTLMESWRATPALVLAANSGSLKARISRLIGVQTLTHAAPRGGLTIVAILCAAGALFASTSFNVTFSHAPDGSVAELAAQEETAPAISLENTQTTAPSFTPPSAKSPRMLASASHSPAQSETAPPPPPPPPNTPAATATPSSPAMPAPPAEHPAAGSYIDEIRAAGLTNITVDELIALKSQGVTADYIRQIRATGLNPRIHDLIAMKAVGVSPEYIKTIRSSWPDVSVHDLIALRAQGIEPADAAQFHQLGLKDITVHHLISLKAVGVTPDYIRELQAAGLSNLSAHDYVSAKAVGVTPEYVRAMRSAGFSNLTMHEYISARAQGITPEFIQKVHDHGFTNLTMRQLIGLKMADVF
ncbi:MAG: M56 family metallopeptidase, partial [Acidobacteriaceae bacterium]|nr:M56 family metallopeptidase [Acidobacteriaceae bacterium]